MKYIIMSIFLAVGFFLSAADLNTLIYHAEKGDVKSQLTLGDMYISGNGVRKNYKTAEYWYNKAAEKGDSKGRKMAVIAGKLSGKTTSVQQNSISVSSRNSNYGTMRATQVNSTVESHSTSHYQSSYNSLQTFNFSSVFRTGPGGVYSSVKRVEKITHNTTPLVLKQFQVSNKDSREDSRGTIQ